jgi:glucose-6-phosphate isomerase
MDMVLYEKPVRIELVGYNLFVNGNQHPCSTRTVRELKKTLVSYPDELADMDVYYMYRNVYKHGDVRLDITVIPPLALGEESSKTHGHYHPGSEDGFAYPEIYQVLAGSAVFLLQKKNRNGSVDVIIVDAREKDVVLIPPGYGHVTANSGEGILVLSNLVYDRFESLYDEYDENRGAAYYYLKGGGMSQNTNYIVQRSERLPAGELNSRYKFSCGDLLAEFHADPGKFAFLSKPGLFFKR